MKNSLFKRVVAAAAAVPMALTQCLTVNTFAVEDTDVASAVAAADEKSTLTLNDLLYIAPDDADQKSNWDLLTSGAIDNAIDNGGLSGVIETEGLYKKLIANSGKYAKLTENITKGLGDIEYELTDSKNIVLTLKATSVVDAFEGDAQDKINKEVDKLKAKYAGIPQFDALVEDLDNLVVFEGVEIEGFFAASIDLSDLENGEISAYLVFRDTVGDETYSGIDIADYALNKLDELKRVAEVNLNELAEKYDIDTTAVLDEINEAEDYYASLINKAVRKVAAGLFSVTFNPFSGDYADYSVLAQALNAKLEAEGVYEKLENHNIDEKLPTSGAALASDATVLKYFEKAVNKFNEISPVAIDIEADELGAFIDELTDISVSIDGNFATFTACYPDNEVDEVRNYLASQGLQFETDGNGNETLPYKIVSVTVRYGGFSGEKVVASADVVRVMETEPIQTTTTTTTSTTTSSTTTTSDTTTSSIISTSSTTSSETTTTSTATQSSTTSSETTTTSTDTTTTTTTTTYIAVAGVYVDAETEAGFYTNIDDSFAKEQVSKLSLFVKYNTISVDENGIETIVDESVSSAYDITGSFKYNKTPATAYDASNTSFLYNIGVLYNGLDIVDQYGNTVITDGAILRTSTDGIVTVPAYIGLKGDADLDNKITARDASMVLDYYANLSSGVDAATVEFSVDSALVDSPDSIYDDFAAFLADVDTAIDPSVAWKTGKDGRRLLASDAGAILTYYSYIQSAEPGKTAWDEVLGNTQA